MKIKIFKAEINDGVADLVATASTIAFHSSISLHQPTTVDYEAVKAIAENIDTRDLFYIDAVLASVGWNKNDDIFDRYETWNARSTPENKQFNYMHDEKDIIGHITKSYILDFNQNRIDSIQDLNELPETFDVIMGSVLYKSWSDPALKERMELIIKEIDQWYVSMECLFPAFDYKLIDSKGKQETVKRNETSAFLTKHLRAYGGSGEYNGYKVGRLLRDFSFSGVGLVKNPANPRSVILNTTKATFFKGNDMPENLDLDVLKNELAEAKKNYDEIKKKMEDARAESEASVSSLSAQVAELQASLAAEKKEKEKMAEEMKNMKKEKASMRRRSQLSEAGFSSDEVENTLAKFDSLEDEMFDAVVATLKSKLAETKADSKKTEEKEEPDTAKCKSKSSVDTEDKNVSTEVLGTAEESKDVPMGENLEEENVKSFASSWFKDLLKTTANIKD